MLYLPRGRERERETTTFVVLKGTPLQSKTLFYCFYPIPKIKILLTKTHLSLMVRERDRGGDRQ